MYEGCSERIIVPPDTQRMKSPGHFIVQFKDEDLFILSRDQSRSWWLIGHTHVRDREPSTWVQLSLNRLRIFKQLKRVRYSLLLRFRYAVIICTWRESPVFNFTLYILIRFLLREKNLTRLQVHELAAVVIEESSEESMTQSCSRQQWSMKFSNRNKSLESRSHEIQFYS